MLVSKSSTTKAGGTIKREEWESARKGEPSNLKSSSKGTDAFAESLLSIVAYYIHYREGRERLT